MAGFNKLVPEIVQSSIWNEASDIRIVWITLLAVKDKDGYVRGDVNTIARLANVSSEVTGIALDMFQKPDKNSNTPDNEGRRIEKKNGGFIILNHHLYRAMDRNEYMREYMRKKRMEKDGENVNVNITQHSVSVSVLDSVLGEGSGEGSVNMLTVNKNDPHAADRGKCAIYASFAGSIFQSVSFEAWSRLKQAYPKADHAAVGENAIEFSKNQPDGDPIKNPFAFLKSEMSKSDFKFGGTGQGVKSTERTKRETPYDFAKRTMHPDDFKAWLSDWERENKKKGV